MKADISYNLEKSGVGNNICLAFKSVQNKYNENKSTRNFNIENLMKEEEEIYIGEDLVEFSDGAVKVGCTSIRNEKVREICKRIEKNSESSS